MFSVIVTAAALACWPASTLADGPTVPFRDSGSGEITDLELVDFYHVRQGFEATGLALHMGRVDFDATLASGLGHTLYFPETVLSHYGYVLDGHGIYTAANGAQLQVEYDGEFERIDDVVYLFVEFRFTEGTGRLAGVTGRADTDVIAAGRNVGDPFVYTVEGTLTFPDRPR
jgi:hypothetical protein